MRNEEMGLFESSALTQELSKEFSEVSRTAVCRIPEGGL